MVRQGATQNLKTRFSPFHSILRQKYSVERFPKGSPTSSLCILQVSEAECQGIKSYACFCTSTAVRMNIDDVVDDVINAIVNLTSGLLLSISKLSHVHAKPTAWPALLCLQRSSTPLRHITLDPSTLDPRPLYAQPSTSPFTLNPRPSTHAEVVLRARPLYAQPSTLYV